MNKYMEMCLREGFFTCGNTKQYTEVINYYNLMNELVAVTHTNVTVLARLTWICSDIDKYSYNYVLHCIYRLFVNNSILNE